MEGRILAAARGLGLIQLFWVEIQNDHVWIGVTQVLIHQQALKHALSNNSK